MLLQGRERQFLWKFSILSPHHPASLLVQEGWNYFSRSNAFPPRLCSSYLWYSNVCLKMLHSSPSVCPVLTFDDQNIKMGLVFQIQGREKMLNCWQGDWTR